jgi:CheY-like chemotaxis protein
MISEKTKILIVDDTPENLDILQGLLQDEYQLFAAPAGEIAIQIAKKQVPDLILLDIMMPGMDGYEVCRQLKADESTKDIPVIFITAKVETNDEVKGFNVGGVDYITKPFSPQAVLARVKAHLALKREKELLIENMQLKEDVERITRHDLKNPLTAIINYPKLIARDNLTENQIEKLDKISDAGVKLLNMINLSLDLYKMEQSTYIFMPEPIDILQILNDIIHEKRHHIRSKRVIIQILVNGAPISEEDSFIVHGEELLFYSMLSNLFKNALEASPRNEKIQISLTKENECLISIHNQGAVPEDIRDHFFEKYTTSGKHGGTGLGTYSAKLIAETLGGFITMESAEQSGTMIKIFFPR